MKQRGASEEPGHVEMCVFFILLLQVTGAASGRLYLSYVVRAGDDVTLSCENVIESHRNCGTTTWIYSVSGQAAAVEPVTLGQIRISRSDKLRVTANCSLAIEKVTDEDAGRYTCRQFVGGPQRGSDAVVDLSVVKLTEDRRPDQVTLTCSVLTNQQCKQTVKWLFKGQDVENDHQDIKKSSSSSCSAAVTFKTSHFSNTPDFPLFRCEVRREENKVHLFTFSSRLSDKDKTTTTTTPSTPSTTSTDTKNMLWLYITVPVVILLVTLVVVIIVLLKRKKEKKNQNVSSERTSSSPANTPSAADTRREMVEPEDGVSYASISYTKRADSKVKNDDEDTVTYSTVRGPSADPDSLYASVNKPDNQTS